MVRYRGTIYVSHGTDKVWALLSDWSRLSQWDENCVLMTSRASENGRFALGIGALWDCKFDFNGRKCDARYRCVEWDSGRRAVFEATSSLIRTRDTLEIIQAPGGCQVSLQFELYYRNILAPLSFTLQNKMQRACPRIMMALKKFVNQQLDGETHNIHMEADASGEGEEIEIEIVEKIHGNHFSDITL